MDLYTIDVKRYKAIFFQTLIANVLAIIGTYFLVRNGVYILSGFDPDKKLTTPVFIILFIISIVNSKKLKKKLEEISTIGDFEMRVSEYEKFYKTRTLWIIFFCFVSCLLCILTARYLNLYLAIYFVIVSIPYYPSLLVFKHELKNDEIIFY